MQPGIEKPSAVAFSYNTWCYPDAIQFLIIFTQFTE